MGYNVGIKEHVPLSTLCVLPNLINPITKLKPLSIIEFVAKNEATPLVQLCISSGWGD